MICAICRKEFTPTRSPQANCSKVCGGKAAARKLGRAHFKRMGKVAWSPSVRAVRQSPQTRTPEYRKAYGSGWRACERFYLKQREVA